jgi:four helix bundle suffix protein
MHCRWAHRALGTEVGVTLVSGAIGRQAEWLAERLLDSQAKAVEEEGGFSERLYAARKKKRANGQNGHE